MAGGRARRAYLWAVSALVLLTACGSVPKLNDALAHARAQEQSSKLFAGDGSLLTTLHAEVNRENVPLAQMPMTMRQAIISIEDARFYQHSALDARAIVRAFFVNTSSHGVREGGSTITQQLVKNTLVGNEKSLKRKIAEAALAIQLEQKYTKDQILEQYLNTVYFGEGAYGVEAAAQTYFSVHAKDLTLPESAMLAGLVAAPSTYDPVVNPKEALARRNVVLDRMYEEHYIDLTTEAKAQAAKLNLKRSAGTARYSAPYFADYVEEFIQQDPQNLFTVLGKTVADRTNALFKGGLRVYTTVDLHLQGVVDQASRQLLYSSSDPYNAFVGIDPKTGYIKAIRGGRDFFNQNDRFAKYNLATHLPGRQPGSSFKLFTLVAALEKGITLTKVYPAPSSIRLSIFNGSQIWNVHNYESIAYGPAITLREATEKSVNVVYAQVVQQVGASNVVDVAHRMGITAHLDAVPSIALGAEEVTPLQMATAYSTLATGGYRINPTPISKITDASGKVLWQYKMTRTQVVSPAIAAVATDALEGVIKRGTGTREQIGDRILAGKTGTSEAYHDAWFAGISPDMVGVSWVGFPQAQISMLPPRTRIQVVGGSWPGAVWKAFMTEALKGLPNDDFPYTVGQLQTVRVDILRNCLAPDLPTSDVIVDRPYLKGQEPTVMCDTLPPPTNGLVPNVVGRMESAATSILQQSSFSPQSRHVYCPAYPNGYVCSQSPTPGSYTLPGSTVTVYVSDDSAVASVPMVLGMSSDNARASLEAAGFTVAIVTEPNAAGPTGCRDPKQNGSGVVWLQSPCAGESAGAGTTVRIYVNP